MTSSAPSPVSEGSVIDDYDLIGVWKLPGLDGLQSGRLSYAKNNTTLTVIELSNVEALFQQMSNRTPETVTSIHGVVETGEHVLLDGCLSVGSQFIMNQSEPGLDQEGNKIPGGATTVRRVMYRAKAMYVSKAPVPRRPTSTRVSVSYTSLFTWLNDYGIKTDIGKESTTITFVPPEQHKVALPGGLSLTLSRGHTIPMGNTKKEFVLPQSASVVFESPSPVEIKWFRPHIVAFANFLMMGVKPPVQPDAYVMWQGRNAVMAFPEYLIHPNPVREENLLGMHFNYQQIAPSFDDAIRHWFSMSKKYEKSMNLYFQVCLVGGAQDPEIRFLRLAQALEAFYRAKHPDEEKSIRRILEYIQSEIPYEIFSSEEEKSSFISGMSDARNYFSHGFLLNKEETVPKGTELLKMTDRAEVLLYCCYLHELEIGDELKADIMTERIKLVNSIESF